MAPFPDTATAIPTPPNMSFVLHSTFHLPTQPYEYPGQGYYHLHPNVPRFSVPPYPASQQRFFRQPSAELEELREYRRALAVISNCRLRQVEKDAAIRQRQQAEADRQRYLTSLATELEHQRRQEELFASHRAEIIRTQQARARLAAAERQLAVNGFLGRVKGTQPVRCICMLLVGLILILPQKATCGPHVVKSRPLSDLCSRPVHSGEPDEDHVKRVENFLSSLFPGLVFRVQPAASTEITQPETDDKEGSRARAEDPKGPQDSAHSPGSADVATTSGSSNSLPVDGVASSTEPTVTRTERTRADRENILSSIERIRNNLAQLQTDFILPNELDHYAPSIHDRDEVTSDSSASSSDLTKLIPYTSTNKPVYKYEHELNGLLEKLDGIDSYGDVEVREKRKEVVKAIERALEGLEAVVGEAVEKRLSLVVSSTPVTEDPLNGFDVDGNAVEEFVPVSTKEQIGTQITDNNVEVAGRSTPDRSQAVGVTLEESTPADEVLPEFNTAVVPDNATSVPYVDSPPTEPDFGPSASIATSESVEPTATDLEPTGSQVPIEEVEAVDAFLSNEEAFPLSPVKGRQPVDRDIYDEVLVLDNDGEESDWSEIEN